MTFSDLSQTYCKFVVTGRKVGGKRFRPMTFGMPKWAFGINLWRGSVWGVTQDGKRKLLKRVYN